ncbi:MAG: hypothetical protein JWR21_907 [Herminiimonas sp.]|nr:hypothetical protein [Herminiimonas sp.]
MSDFNWRGEQERSDVIVSRVDAIAVYRNEDGDIVIRQQGQMGEDDSTIVIPVMHAKSLLEAIQGQIILSND